MPTDSILVEIERGRIRLGTLPKFSAIAVFASPIERKSATPPSDPSRVGTVRPGSK